MSQHWALVARKANGTWGGLEGGWSVGQRGSPAPLLCPGETTPGILCPVLGLSVQEGQGTVGESPVQGNKDD